VQAQTSDRRSTGGQLFRSTTNPKADLVYRTNQQSSDAVLLYPHVIEMTRRLVSRMGMDRPAVDRMGASVLLQKFLAANAKDLRSDEVIGSLARDLDLSEGTNEAEALLNLCRFRTRQDELGEISWRSFVQIYPTLRASGFSDLSALNEVLEI
jgi:hypothetical protein